MVIATDYPFLDIFWTMLVFFAFVIWFVILFRVFADIFRRHDISGWGKAGWTLFVIVLPFIGVLIYLIANSDSMGQRDLELAQASQAQFDAQVRAAAGSGGAAAEIEKAKQLLDRGSITQNEFDAIKAKAIA
jgi:hypothetical protein